MYFSFSIFKSCLITKVLGKLEVDILKTSNFLFVVQYSELLFVMEIV